MTTNMYNNDVTYDKKWDTEENNKALDELHSVLIKTACWSDCPLAWAVEVLELVKEMEHFPHEMSQIKEKYGQLMVYFSAENDKEIDRLIRKCEVKLARKGAYYPLEKMGEWKTTYYKDDEEIVTYPYREFINENN